VQGKLAGKMKCAKPDQSHVAPVGDSPDHVMMLSTQKCTWSQGDIGGDKLKDETDTFTSDASGGVSHDRSYGVGTLAGGDKYFIEFKGTTTLKGQTPVNAECKWKFGIRGGGSRGETRRCAVSAAACSCTIPSPLSQCWASLHL
jgi:hypothetical protein